MKAQRGFTLIELLLGLAIFAILSISVYTAFATGIGAWRRAQAHSATYQTARLVLEEMAGDLRKAVRLTGSPFIGEAERISFLLVRRDLTPTPPQELFEIRRVTYELKDDGLFRLEESYAEGLGDDHREPDWMAGPLAGLRFEYASREDEDSPWEWEEDWESREAIPPGVRMSLLLQDEGEKIEFTKTVFIPQGLLEKK